MTTAQATLEELGLLVGGPMRATEVAIAGLLDAGLIRISRDGWVTAVDQPGRSPASLLEARIMGGLRYGGCSLRDVAGSAAVSAAAQGLREHLVARGLIRARRRRLPRLHPWLFGAAAVIGVGGVVDGPRWDLVGLAGALALWALVLLARGTGALTREGHQIVGRTIPTERLSFTAVHGLRGKAGLHGSVAAMFGLPESVVRMLPGGKPGGGGGCGSGSSGCSSSDGSSCGGGGCGGGGGD